jgi:uncharacterized Zn-finger protein
MVHRTTPTAPQQRPLQAVSPSPRSPKTRSLRSSVFPARRATAGNATSRKYQFQDDLVPSLTDHHSEHIHRRHQRRFSCPVTTCPRTFNLRADLARHRATHQASSSRAMLDCPVRSCPKTFTRKDNLSRHLTRHHRHDTYSATTLR